MKCLDPQRIRNKYTGKWMFVPCQKCDACLIQKGVGRGYYLTNQLKNQSNNVFFTLTYDNNNIPFIINGMPNIYRLDKNGIPAIIEKTEEIFNITDYVPIRNFSPKYVDPKDCISVLYYRDFQLFLKRIRKAYYEQFGQYGLIKFFISGEYGSTYQRGHMHGIFSFSEKCYADFFFTIVSECWKMCDRHRLKDYCTYSSVGVSGYLASYVSSNVSSNGLFQFKRFRPFTRRSKGFDYGIDQKELQKIEIIIKREYDKEIPVFSREDFEVWNGKDVGSFSPCLISKRVFSTYFSKPCSTGNLSFNDFRLWCYRVYRVYFKVDGHGRYSCGIYEKLKGADLSFISAFKRFCFLLDICINFKSFCNYVDFLYKISAFYDSQLIRDSMLMFEKLKPLEYLQYCYNTFANDPSVSFVRSIYRRFGLSLSDSIGIDFYNKYEKEDVKQSIVKYRSLLLPKHFNDLLNSL